MSAQTSFSAFSRRFWTRHWHLLAQFTRRAVAVETRGSALGALWWVLDPFLNLALYSTVFGIFMRGHRGRIDEFGMLGFPLFIFIGLTFLNVVTETLGQSNHTILGHANLVKRVVFPLPLLTLAEMGPRLLRLAISGVIIALAVLAGGIGFHWQWVVLPLIVLPALLISLGLGWALAALGVYFRDLQHLIRFLSNLLFYISAVFYDEDIVRKTPFLWDVLKYNPMLQIIDEARKILLFHDPVNWELIGLLNLGGTVVAVGGFILFQKLRDGFADVL